MTAPLEFCAQSYLILPISFFLHAALIGLYRARGYCGLDPPAVQAVGGCWNVESSVFSDCSRTVCDNT